MSQPWAASHAAWQEGTEQSTSTGFFPPKSCAGSRIGAWPVPPGTTLILIIVQLLSHVQVFETPWTAACQASLSFSISQSLLKLTSIELVMSSNHLII